MLLLVPSDTNLFKQIHQARVTRELTVLYRTRVRGVDSKQRKGRLEEVNKGLYLNAAGLPAGSLVEVEGRTAGAGVLFSTGWVSADAVVRVEL